MLFEEMQSGRKPEWMTAKLKSSEKAASNIESLEGPDDEFTLDLESPKFCPRNAGIFSLVPQLSFEIDSEDDFDIKEDEEMSMKNIASLLREHHKCFSSLKVKWTQTFSEIDASHASVVKDIQALQSSSRSFRVLLGSHSHNLSGTVIPVWSGLRNLSDELQVTSHEAATSLATTNSNLSHIQHSQSTLQQSIIETS